MELSGIILKMREQRNMNQRFETLGEKRHLNIRNLGDSRYIYPIFSTRMIYSESYVCVEMLSFICNSGSVSSYLFSSSNIYN